MSGGWGSSGPAYPVAGGFGVGVGADARYYLEGTIDPSAGAGIAAPVGSLYLRNSAGVGEAWQKIGAADTAWAIIGGGGPALFRGARIYPSFGLTLVDGAGLTLVPFDTAEDDQGGYLYIAGNGFKVPAGLAGRHRLFSQMEVPAPVVGAGVRASATYTAAWFKNGVRLSFTGAGVVGDQVLFVYTDDNRAGSGRLYMIQSFVLNLSVGDTLTLKMAVVTDVAGSQNQGLGGSSYAELAFLGT